MLRRLRNLSVLGLLVSFLGLSQDAPPVQRMSVGQALDRRISGHQSHFYQVMLQRGEFLELEVFQNGIDLSVSLMDLQRGEILKVDSPNRRQGPEAVFYISPRAGALRIQVRAPDEYILPGKYRILLKALRRPTPRDQGRAQAFRAMTEAYLLSKTGDHQGAADRYGEAFQIWHSFGEGNQAALTLAKLGRVYRDLNQASQALESYQKAYQLAVSLNDPSLQVEILISTGRVYANQAAAEEVEAYQKALAIAESSGLKASAADAHHDSAVYFHEYANFENALGHYRSAHQIWTNLGDALRVAESERNIGDIYLRLGRPQLALDHFKSALEISERLGDMELKADCLGWITWVHIQQGDFERAFEYNSKALQLDRTASLLQSRGSIHKLQGVQFQRQQLSQDAEAAFRQALKNFRAALEIERGRKKLRSQANLLSEIAQVHGFLGEISQAQQHIERALRIYDKGNAPAPHAFALYVQAQILQLAGDLPTALVRIEETLQIVRSLRHESASHDLRISFSSRRHEYVEYYIDLLNQLEQQNPGQGYAQKALQAFDQSQAQSLIESLLEAQAGIRQTADGRLLDQETDLQAKLGDLDWRIISLNRQPDRLQFKAQIDALESERRKLARQLEDLKTRLRTSSPRYAELSSPEPLSLTQIQQEILDGQTLLLAYSLGTQQSYLWLVSQSSLEVFPIGPRWQIEGLVEHLVRESDSSFPRKKTLRSICRRLSQILLKPLTGKLGRKRLIIVGDGPVPYIPFDALPNPTAVNQQPAYSRLLVLDHEIVTSPSVSTLAMLRRQLAQRPSAPKKLALFADPVFSREDQRVKQAMKGSAANPLGGSGPAASTSFISPAFEASDLRFKRLRHSAQEAQDILDLVPASQRFSAIGFQANREALLGLDQYEIVHFATHGFFHPQNPQLSAIVLSLIDDQLRDRRGLLRTHEIYRLKLSADLVVLSACQTARGKHFKGEGIVGLTRGFMYAGAARVVVSLWKVDDEATSVLMRHFYKAMLQQHLTPSAALRQAKIQMIESEQWKDPYHWAGFVLQGDWR